MQVVSVILLKELIILPNQEIKIELNNKLSKLIVKNAIDKNNNLVLVVSPIDAIEEEPSIEDLPKVGVIAKIKNKIQLSNGNIRITLRGLKRVVVKKYFLANWNKNVLNSEYEELELPKFLVSEENAIKRKLISTLKEYIASSDNVSNSILNTVEKAKDLNAITDIITSFLPFNFAKKSEYMQNINPLNRGKNLLIDLEEEIALAVLDEEITDKVNELLEENQRDFILKEKIKAIKEELGEKSTQEQDKEKYLNILNNLKIASSTKNKIASIIEKYALMNEASPEVSVERTYLEWILNLPWNKVTKDPTDDTEIIKKLDSTHYGLTEIKSRIREYVAIKKHNKSLKSPIICLIGPPGVGKTSMAIAIAAALNRKFYKISVGGLNDSTELIGSRRTYLGASPGKIIQGLRKVESKNPVILIDEVDKMTKDYKGDPASTLLEIIDPVQNKYFTDNYIEEAFDLSEVLFILTANYYENIPEAILDRVEVIDLYSYTIFEKKDIAKNYLLPKIFKEYNYQVKFSDDILLTIIKDYTLESGVRELERVLNKIVRKLILNHKSTVSLKDLKEYLGNKKNNENYLANAVVGEVNVLGVSNNGGFAKTLEVVTSEGDGKILITGAAGDILKESVYVALSYLKNNYKVSLDKKNIHLHFLEAAIKKDGPSAGVAITIAILSIIRKKKIMTNIAFTGEISLNGQILKVGGLKEKLIAAYNNDINIVYIPKANMVDLEEIPKEVKAKLEIIPVSNFQEIYTKIFK